MNDIWHRNKEFKYVYGICILILIGSLAIWNYYTISTLSKVNDINYDMVASLYGEVKSQCPDFEESAWIAILNQGMRNPLGEDKLSQYSIFKGDVISISQKNLQNRLLLWGNLLFSLTGVALLLVLFLYLKRRQKKLNYLVNYIQRVEQGEYFLDLSGNEEDELSGLKNELYKVTVILKESAELSKKQKRALADSVSDISHQLKTPMTSVMVLLDNLTESTNMEEAVRKRFLSEITKQLTNVNWLIASLLKLSRLDAGVVEFENKEFSIDELLDKVVDDLELQAEWKRIPLIREGSSHEMLVGDFHWISEAVTNIVKNAIEHSNEESPVTIYVEENTVYTTIKIHDIGEVISAEEQKHIFERFYHAKYAKADSVGIGLSMAKEIIEKQNGYLTVSSSEEKGTEFKIKFLKV